MSDFPGEGLLKFVYRPRMPILIADDINFSDMSIDDSDKAFHSVIGHIEDIIMDEKFLHLHSNFLEMHWKEFECEEENKLVYMDIFQLYNETIEKFIEEELMKRIKHFSMSSFEKELMWAINFEQFTYSTFNLKLYYFNFSYSPEKDKTN